LNTLITNKASKSQNNCTELLPPNFIFQEHNLTQTKKQLNKLKN